MYIAPNSIIRVLSHCPLDNSYEHTILFQTKEAQTEYFISKTKFTFTNQTYTRYATGVIRINRCADDMYDCNYLMFQNTSFGNKWFYAFISAINYVSNNVAEITFQIDIMQTWHFDYTLGQTFVERQHTETDVIGEHILDENFSSGEYAVRAQITHSPQLATNIVATTRQDGTPPYIGAGYHGQIFGLYTSYTVNPNETIQWLQNFNDNGFPDSVLGCFYSTGQREENVSAPTAPTTIGNYTPKNKKLLIYPYVRVNCVSPSGSEQEYKYELFTNRTPTFKYIASDYPTPAWLLYPRNYKGLTENVTAGLENTNTVQIGCSGDSFKAWLAQSTGSGAAHMAKEKVSSAIMNTTLPIGDRGEKERIANRWGNIAGGAVRAVSTIGSALGSAVSTILGGAGVGATLANTGMKIGGSAVNAAQEADNCLGTASGTSLILITERVGTYDLRCETIREEYAATIDDYFTKYGYKINRVKVPNRNARPHWTYVKTMDCVIDGSCPADDESAICQIYNNGITFWNNPTEVGNYTLNNAPV